MAETLKAPFGDGELLLIPYTAVMVTERHVEWLNNKDLMRYSEQRHRMHTMESQGAYLDGFPPDSFAWLIREDDGGGVYDIGTITAHIDRPNDTANMGVLVSVGGKGYGQTAWHAVMDWLTVRKVECGCMRSNRRMRNLAWNCGFTLEAVVPGHFLLDGKPEDLFLLGAYL